MILLTLSINKLIKNKSVKTLFIFVLSFLIILSSSPNKVFAHEAYFFQVLIDETTNTFVGNVVYDNAIMELNHIEQKYLISQKPIFTIPASDKDKTTTKHMERAYQIRDFLIPTLNQMLLILNDNANFTDTKEMLKAAEAIENNGEYNGWTVSTSGNLTNLSKGNRSYSFITSIPIGYASPIMPDGSQSLVYSENYNNEVYISVKDVIHQGKVFYAQKITLSNASDGLPKPGIIENKLVELFNSFILGIRNMLGLYTIDELIFNDGLRDGDSYYKGVLPRQWFDVAVAFHLILQAVAWSLIGTAVVKTLFEINTSTLAGSNPIIRTRIYDKMRDFFVVGFLLVGALLLFNTLLDLNHLLVRLFKTTIPKSGSFGNMVADNKSLAGVFLSVFYLIIAIFLNITYVTRAITVAVLLASAPLFIVSIVFQNKNTLFFAWFKELFSNIFLQTFQALILALTLNVQSFARPVEHLVIGMSLIPLTNMFRQLITGNSGSMATSLGMGGLSLVGGAVSSAKNSFGKSKVTTASTSSNKSNSSNIDPTIQDIPSRKQHSTTAPSYRSTETVSKRTDEGLDLEKNEFNTGGFKFNTDDVTKKDIVKNTALGLGKIGLGMVETTAGLVTADMDDGHTFRSGISTMMNGQKQLGSSALYASKNMGNKAISKVNKFAKEKYNITPYTNLNQPKDTSPNQKSSMQNSKVTQTSQTTQTTPNKEPFVPKTLQKFVNKTAGNILGSEVLPNGDRAVHRDREKLREMGLVDVRTNKNGISTHVYDPSKLSEEDKDNLKYIFASKNDPNSSLQSKGVENISIDKNGHYVVEYNKTGRAYLGYDDIYQTNSRIVETKSNHQPLESKLTYDINAVQVNTHNTNAPDYDDLREKQKEREKQSKENQN